MVRTTVAIREDLYQQLKMRYGNLSEGINTILGREFKRDHSMFGSLKPRNPAELEELRDVRDHRDRD